MLGRGSVRARDWRQLWYHGLVDEGRQVVKAMAVIRRPRDGALLVSEYTGPESAPFHRLLGGHVEFGEYAADTIQREFIEEIAQGVADVRLLGVVENLFRWRGRDQHEVVFVFTARFDDPAAYEIAEQRVMDDTDGYTLVLWRQPGTVSPPLYPEGVAGLVAGG
jgi:ADP-ribose pyrophosphatase YjhB (NUDIX family)